MALLPDPRDLPAAALLQALNHFLAGQPWLRERLVPYAGRTCNLDVFPAQVRIRIGADGALERDREAGEADASIRASPLTMARLLRGDEGARGGVHVEGDAELAAALGAVLKDLRWDVEEDLSALVGDVGATRAVGVLRRLAAWPASAGRSLAANVAEYLVEEQPLLARKEDVQRWAQEVDALRDAVERLEKRIARLPRRDTPQG